MTFKGMLQRTVSFTHSSVKVKVEANPPIPSHLEFCLIFFFGTVSLECLLLVVWQLVITFLYIFDLT